MSTSNAAGTKNVSVGLLCHDFRRDSGRGVDRYSFYLGTNLARYVDPRVVQVGKIRRYPKDWLTKVWRYPFATRKIDADVYHATSYLDGFVGVFAKRRPLITTIHDLLPLKSSDKDYQPTRSPIKDYYETICLKVSSQSDLIITPFRAYIDDIVSELNYPRERIRQVYYGVDHECFEPGDMEKPEGRRLLYVGGINQEKGIFDLVAAFRNLEKSLDGLTLTIGGRGPHLQKLKQKLINENLSHSVKLLGFVEEIDLPQLYRSADLVVIPSKTGFALMSLESMSCGTPALVCDTPDNREIFGDKLRCRTGDPSQLEKKIFEILSVEGRAKYLSDLSIRTAEKYSWKRMAKETSSVYLELVGK